MAASGKVELLLFVQGQSSNSSAALKLVRDVCDSRLPGAYSLEVIDIHQQPGRAQQAGVMATPALVRLFPEPVLRIIGRLDEARLREGLGLND